MPVEYPNDRTDPETPAACPFCQGANLSLYTVNFSNGTQEYAASIRCEDCHARGPTIHQMGSRASVEAAAKTAWETRV